MHFYEDGRLKSNGADGIGVKVDPVALAADVFESASHFFRTVAHLDLFVLAAVLAACLERLTQRHPRDNIVSSDMRLTPLLVRDDRITQ